MLGQVVGKVLGKKGKKMSEYTEKQAKLISKEKNSIKYHLLYYFLYASFFGLFFYTELGPKFQWTESEIASNFTAFLTVVCVCLEYLGVAIMMFMLTLVEIIKAVQKREQDSDYYKSLVDVARLFNNRRKVVYRLIDLIFMGLTIAAGWFFAAFLYLLACSVSEAFKMWIASTTKAYVKSLTDDQIMAYENPDRPVQKPTIVPKFSQN